MKKKKTIKQKKIPLPHDISEEDFIVAINNVAKKLGHKFKFGYHSFEDMKQQATIFALECLNRYDKSRPLENFLWTHVRNRLFNFKRDNYQRPDKPCLKCEHHDPYLKCSTNNCAKFCNKTDCELYRLWESRNNNKKNLMTLQYIEDNSIFSENDNFISNIANKEIVDIIDQKIPASERENYLKLKNGVKITRVELCKLQQIIIGIVKDHGYT
jgi:hypothetical protein